MRSTQSTRTIQKTEQNKLHIQHVVVGGSFIDEHDDMLWSETMDEMCACAVRGTSRLALILKWNILKKHKKKNVQFLWIHLLLNMKQHETATSYIVTGLWARVNHARTQSRTEWVTVSLIRFNSIEPICWIQFNRTKHIIMHIEQGTIGWLFRVQECVTTTKRRPCITIMVTKLSECKMILLK